jgi:hypothetical protein
MSIFDRNKPDENPQAPPSADPAIAVAAEIQAAQLKKANLDAETAEINRQLAINELELKKATLEDLQEKNQKLREAKEARRDKQLTATKAARAKKDYSDSMQSVCTHLTGGEGVDGLWLGDKTESASVNVEVDPLGFRTIRCHRCDKLWPELLADGTKNPEFYTWLRAPHRGQKPAVPIQFKVPGVNAPLPAAKA